MENSILEDFEKLSQKKDKVKLEDKSNYNYDEIYKEIFGENEEFLF
jgi:hypothetical protein